MVDKRDYSKIARQQCERTAKIYYAFRKKGGTANDLIEIPAMKRLMGDVNGKKILDAGCGFGSYSIYCVQQGATVTAVDISPTMIGLARKEAAEVGVEINFKVGDVSNLKDIPAETFDMVVSSVAACFQITRFFREMARILKPGGVFCFSDVHPMLGSGRQVDREGQAALIVDHYFHRGLRKAMNVFGKMYPSDEDYQWRWEQYTLEDYCASMTEAGFLIEALLEPQPDPATKHLNPKLYHNACRYPYFVLIRAIKATA